MEGEVPFPNVHHVIVRSSCSIPRVPAQHVLTTARPYHSMHLHRRDFTASTSDLGCKRTSAGKALAIISSKNAGASQEP